MTPNEEEILRLLKAWAPEVSRLLSQAGYFTLPEGTEKAKIAQTVGLDPGGRLYQRVKTAALEKNGEVWTAVLDEYSLKEFKAGARKVAGMLKLPFPKWDWSEAAQNFFEKDGLKKVKLMTQTDIDSLRNRIQYDFGLNPRDFAKKYASSYSCSEARLERIKRSEVHSASQQGGYQFAIDADAETKEWRATHINRWPRPSHRAQEGMIIGINDIFPITGEAVPGEVNCRCYLLFGFDGSKINV